MLTGYFNRLLEGEDAAPFIHSPHPPVIVLGRTNWFSAALMSLLAPWTCTEAPRYDAQLYELGQFWIEMDILQDKLIFRRSKPCHKLPFGSQEMLLDGLFRRTTPEKWDPNVTTAHPGLANLPHLLLAAQTSPEGFVWPTTEALPGGGTVSSNEWPEVGPLAYTGYHVGTNGLSKHDRQSLLTQTFERPSFPAIHPKIAEWGTGCSSERLQKLANSIAAFVRNAKRRNPAAYKRSVQQWENDLALLKSRYYDGHFDFSWPNA